MTRALLIRGMLAGLLAGLLAVGFAEIFGEPSVERAIGFNSALNLAAGDAPEPELVSRAAQRGLGLPVAGAIYGIALGGLFSLVFSLAYGRMAPMAPRSLAALLAVAGFVALALVPQLKYPASPPAVGEADTIGLRTALYFEMVFVSVGAVVLAALLGRRLATRFGAWNAAIIAGAAFVAVVGAVQLALPDQNEVPAAFPASVLWHFRIASLGMHAVMWTALGLVFGVLAERRLVPRTDPICRAHG